MKLLSSFVHCAGKVEMPLPTTLLFQFRWITILLALSPMAFAEVFSIQPNGMDCRVYLGKQLLVERIHSGLERAAQADLPIRVEDTCLPDGRRIHNAWCEADGYRFRLEIELASDGSSVEFTTKTELPAYNTRGGLPPQLSLHIPSSVLDQETTYCGYSGHGRAAIRREGSLANGQMMPGYPWRFFVLKSKGRELSFDCNPIGPGEVCSMFESGVVSGMASIRGNANGLDLFLPTGSSGLAE